MGEKEIEHFLVAKLRHGLKVGSKKLPLHANFTTLTDLYEEKLNSALFPSEMSDLRDQLYDLTNTMAECRLLSKYTLNGRIRDIRADLKIKIKQLENPSNQTPAAMFPETSLHPNTVSTLPDNLLGSLVYSRLSTQVVSKFKIYGFEDCVKSVEKMVFEKQSEGQFKAIAIIGRMGIGKTTLAQQIFNKEEVKTQFLPRIWVCNSKQPNEKEDPKSELISRILISLGIEEKTINDIYVKHSLKGLIHLLHLNLKGKKYIIVVDDVWNTDLMKWYEQLSVLFNNGDQNREWGDKFTDGLPKGNGGRVIVTTRSEELAVEMVGKENIYEILPLADEENWWKTFDDQIPKDGGVVTNSEKLKKELLMNCGGIPLAAKLMGQIMADDILKSRNQNLPVGDDLGQSESLPVVADLVQNENLAAVGDLVQNGILPNLIQSD